MIAIQVGRSSHFNRPDRPSIGFAVSYTVR
jgi:hypothetical protein